VKYSKEMTTVFEIMDGGSRRLEKYTSGRTAISNSSLAL